MFRSLLFAIIGILFANVSGQTPAITNTFALASKIQIPLEVGGKQVGTVSLSPGTKVNLLQWDGNAFIASQNKGKPFKVSKKDLVVPEGLDLDLLAHELAPRGTAVGDPVLAVTVQHAILISDPSGKPVSTPLEVRPLNFPKDAVFTYSWKQVQDVLSPFAAPVNPTNSISFTPPDAAATVANISGSGVFEIRLTVTDTRHNLSASRNTWVNVWDSRSHIVVNGKEDPLCVAPGILPPPTVRNLSPDPGPYFHPRLYCTDRDWAEISKRSQNGKIASKALCKLKKSLEEHFENPSEPFAKLTDALIKYADAGFQGTLPDLTMGIPSKLGEKGPDWSDARNKFNEYCNQLRDASLVAWIDQDPSVPQAQVLPEKQARFRKLAKATASISHILLHSCWDEKTGNFNKEYPLYLNNFDKIGDPYSDMSAIGISYDFVAPWMNRSELRAVRDFLFAQSARRTTGARVVFFAPGVHGRLQRGEEQNGDFMNIEEAKVLNALAVEGEEGGVSPSVLKAFGDVPKPDDHETSPDFKAYNWMKNTDVDSKGACVESKPYPEASSWPHAAKVQVDNLQRGIWWNDDAYVSPWGFQLNKEAYYGFSAWGLWPTAVAWAIHGAENQYVTSLYYQTVLHLLYSCYQSPTVNKSEDYESNYFLYDHHDGGGDYRQNHVVLMKYMYPDDAAVDYIYAGNAPQLGFNPFMLTLFGLDPGINGKVTTLKDVEILKKPVLTKVDPQQGFVVTRSGWGEEETALHFDEGWHHTGHMHAEKGNFSFFALGRPWSFAPGYHVTDSTWQSEVLIQDLRYTNDPLTQGFMGEGPNAIPQGSDYKRCFPTPPGKLFQVTETPDKSCVIMAGDNATAYSYCYGENQVETPLKRIDYLCPGLIDDLASRNSNAVAELSENLKLTTNYNPVQYAYRTILFVRGEHPYALIMDDINKDGTPRNYRWQMNCSTMFGPPSLFTNADGKKVPSDLDAEPGATTAEAVLLHAPMDNAPADNPKKTGLPRLLVRDFSEAADVKRDPVIEVHKQSASTDTSNGDIHRLFITRNQAVEPKFKVLLYPFRTGDKLPETKWNEDHSALTIDFGGGKSDIISFDRSNPDHRTRVGFSRLKG